MAQGDITWMTAPEPGRHCVTGWIDFPTSSGSNSIKVDCGFVPAVVQFMGTDRTDQTTIAFQAIAVNKMDGSTHFSMSSSAPTVDMAAVLEVPSAHSHTLQSSKPAAQVDASATNVLGFPRTWSMDLAVGENGGKGFGFLNSALVQNCRRLYFIAWR